MMTIATVSAKLATTPAITLAACPGACATRSNASQNTGRFMP